jgi:formylglycine-generating enzyme required for sulfatase activity
MSIVAGCAGGQGASPAAISSPAATTSVQTSAASPSATPSSTASSSSPPSTPSSAASPSAAASSAVEPSHPAGATRKDSHGIEQVWVPAGTFTMGSDDTTLTPPDWAKDEAASERPAHEVAISNGFWVDRTEATNAAFKAFADAGGYTDRALWSDKGWTWLGLQNPTSLPKTCEGDAPAQPRACINWFEAEAYAKWRGGSLPTEAQWEFAARGPESRVYPWGDKWDPAKANVVGSTASMPVGGYPDGASWVGALDMSGNLMEWVSDWYSTTYYGDNLRDDPTGPETGTRKVEKGGWWGADPYVARAAYRHFEDPPTYQDHHIGVRVVSGN